MTKRNGGKKDLQVLQKDKRALFWLLRSWKQGKKEIYITKPLLSCNRIGVFGKQESSLVETVFPCEIFRKSFNYLREQRLSGK